MFDRRSAATRSKSAISGFGVRPSARPLARKSADAIPPVVRDVLRTSGHPLDATDRAYFEPRFERDFSHIRIHDDAQAAHSARETGALAYAVGQHVIVDPARYRAGTVDGRRLLAHELAHTVQQADAAPFTRLELASASAEHAADAAAHAVSTGQPVGPIASTGMCLARQSADGAPSAKPKVPFPSEAAKLTKEQIIDIYGKSANLNDFTLNLGLGPVSRERLLEFLLSKGFEMPGPQKKEDEYRGPAVIPNNEPYDRRHRYIKTPVDDPLQYQLTEVYATPEEANDMQKQVDRKEASDRAAAALAAAAGGGPGSASRAFVANASPPPWAAGPARTQAAGPTANPWFGKDRPYPNVPDTSTPYRPDPNRKTASEGGIVWTSPQTLPERMAMQAARSGEGEVAMKGPFGDPKYQAPGWVKMQYKTTTADGNKIEIHYMFNTITKETDQFKFLSRGEYKKPRIEPRSDGDKP